MTSIRVSLFAIAFLMLLGFVAVNVDAQNATYTDLYDFQCTNLDYQAQTSSGICYPGKPGIIAQGTDGNLYGMGNDQFSHGTIFRITRSGTLTNLYAFSEVTGGSEGLTLGPDGNFYGVTYYGGYGGECPNNLGSIFRLTPTGQLKNLHCFDGMDGQWPASPPIVGDDGYLYGTAFKAGYKISVMGDFQLLTTSIPYAEGATGHGSFAPLLLATDGNFYGVIPDADRNSGSTGGTIYQMTPTGAVTVLYNFEPGANNAYLLGEQPYGALTEGADGNLYGTTVVGGIEGCGVAYQLAPDGNPSREFSIPGGNSGCYPYTGLVAASDGSLYGVTSYASQFTGGTFYSVTMGGAFNVSYALTPDCAGSFCHGSNPYSTPMQATDGRVYGMTNQGGFYDQGVFYSLDVGAPAFVSTIQPSGTIGQIVGILGQNFTDATNISFNGIPANYTVVSDTYLTAVVPPGATTGPIAVAIPANLLRGRTSDQMLSTIRNFRILTGGYNSSPLSTSTAVTSSQSPSASGQSVTLTCTITTQDGGSATGSVTFYDGGTALGSSSVSGNIAMYPTNLFTTGTHTITATYSGDFYYLGSSSAVLTQVVNPVVTSANGTLSATRLDFGSVAVGTNVTQPALLVINTSLALASVQANGDFSLVSNTCALNVSLTAGSVCTLQIEFKPVYQGRRWFPLVVQDGNGNTSEFSLEGTGIGPVLAFTPGVISTVAGGGPGFVDGVPAVNSALNYPNGVTVDAAGNLYIADYGNHRIRKVEVSTGIITTVAGNGSQGYGGDGSVATTASLFNPRTVAVDAAGNLFIADANNQRVRKVDASTGYISTIAGTGTTGYNGDGEAAAQASLTTPDGVAVDQNGNIFIADTYNNRIRKIDAVTGTISTVAGDGTSGFGGDGGSATSAILNTPADLTFDGTGNLYIADSFNQRIRRVDGSTGNINTVAGNGGYGYSGDGVTAVNTTLAGPYGIALDAAGNFYIADGDNARVRKVNSSASIISTVAGNGVASYGGDGGAATSASLNAPHYVALDHFGNLYIADAQNGRIRKVDVTTATVSFSFVNVGQTSSAQIVAVSNVGNIPLSLSQISASANFAVQTVGSDCTTGTPVQPGGTCNLGVVFNPTIAGNPLSGTLTITDDAPGSPHAVSLSGVGVGVPAASLSTPAISFGNQTLNTTSASQGLTLMNTGTGDLSIATIAIAGANAPDFAQTNNCPTTLVAGGSCTIGVTFTPSVASAESAGLSVSDNASGRPQTVSLTGTGFVPPPVLLSITINPSNPVVLAGSTLQLTATGNYSDGSTADLTSSVSWASAQPSIASIGTAAGSQGLVTGVATGTDVISAAFGTLSSSSMLTVNFATTGSLHLARSNHTATQLNNGKVLIVGGVDSSGIPIATAELYDPATGTSALTGSLAAPRQYHTATLLNNGKVLIVGGCGGGCNGQDASSELYDPAIGTFTPTGNLGIARDIHTATLLSNGKVLIAGGYGGGGFGILVSAELYDPSTGTFTLTGNLNIAREWHVATALTTGKVLITGGYQGGLQNTGELYDPSTGTFTLTGSMNVARDVHTATLLNGGQVLIAGGWGGGASDVPSAELYDPVSGNFIFVGNLNTARQQHTATLLSNGKVLITGGSDTSGNYFASVEAYDPSTGAFSATGNLNTARAPHTATLLSNGNVLVVGGANSSGSLASAELYVPDVLTPANLVSIAVTPANSTLDLGTTQQFTATGTFADTSTAPLQSVTWIVSNSSLVTITNDVTNRGTVLTSASGSATITACTGPICGFADLTIGMPKVSLSPASLAFGNQTIGTASTVQSVTLNNTGNGTLSITSISLAGANSADFTESTTCGSTLASGGTCSITVGFVPTASGSRSASVSIADNVSGSPQTVSLTGTGLLAATTTAITSSSNPSVFNQPVSFTATITSVSGTPGGSVTFSDGVNALGSASVSGGSASLTVATFAVGSHSITASYSGDASHGGGVSTALTQTVGKAATTTTVASSKNPQQVSQPITFMATVASQFGGAATGSIVFKSGNTTLGTVALSGNQASLTTSFSSAGTRSVTAQYAGDANHAASSSAVLSQSVVAKFSTTTMLASLLNPSFIGQAVTFTATVTSAGGTPPDGELITFRRGGTALGTAALSGGIAMFTTTALPTGSSNITAVFVADTVFSSSTSTALAQVVNKYNTSVTFTSSANPSLYGQSVTLTAIVVSAGPAIATGNVVFRNGATNLATVALDSNGVATLTRANLPVGSLSLTATYGGDTQSATNAASLSQAVNLVPTTTALVSSRNPSTFGQSVKFTATITTNTGVTATGTVTFTSGATTLGTANLSGGKASVTTTALPRGTNTVTATYNGTANIAASSGSVTQQVN